MFFLINKSLQISSFQVIARLRKILGIKKIGHTGTLDPLATGLLLIATGNSTKLIPYIDRARKTYIFTIRLDGFTASGDLDTPVQYIDSNTMEYAKNTLTIDVIEKIVRENFFGTIEQIPPAYSAIWIDGERAYKLVREGREVIIPKRSVQIFSYRVVSFSFPELTIEMEVSAGTYIRSIARDLGVSLGLGGYVTMLHRTRIGHLDESLSKKFEDIITGDAISYEHIFPDFVSIFPSREIIANIRNGLVFPNIIGLEPWKKYFVREWEKYISLIGEQEGIVRICANNIE